MKKLIFAVVISIIAVSCSTYTYTPAPTVPTPKSKHTVTADYRSVEIKSLVTAPIVADLKVSSKNTHSSTYQIQADIILVFSLISRIDVFSLKSTSYAAL